MNYSIPIFCLKIGQYLLWNIECGPTFCCKHSLLEHQLPRPLERVTLICLQPNQCYIHKLGGHRVHYLHRLLKYVYLKKINIKLLACESTCFMNINIFQNSKLIYSLKSLSPKTAQGSSTFLLCCVCTNLYIIILNDNTTFFSSFYYEIIKNICFACKQIQCNFLTLVVLFYFILSHITN